MRAACGLGPLGSRTRRGERGGLERGALLRERKRARLGLGLLPLHALARSRLLERMGLRFEALAQRVFFLALLAHPLRGLARRSLVGFGASGLRLGDERFGGGRLRRNLAQRSLRIHACVRPRRGLVLGLRALARGGATLGLGGRVRARLLGRLRIGTGARERRGLRLALLLRVLGGHGRRTPFGLLALAGDLGGTGLGFGALASLGVRCTLHVFALARGIQRMRFGAHARLGRAQALLFGGLEAARFRGRGRFGLDARLQSRLGVALFARMLLGGARGGELDRFALTRDLDGAGFGLRALQRFGRERTLDLLAPAGELDGFRIRLRAPLGGAQELGLGGLMSARFFGGRLISAGALAGGGPVHALRGDAGFERQRCGALGFLAGAGGRGGALLGEHALLDLPVQRLLGAFELACDRQRVRIGLAAFLGDSHEHGFRISEAARFHESLCIDLRTRARCDTDITFVLRALLRFTRGRFRSRRASPGVLDRVGLGQTALLALRAQQALGLFALAQLFGGRRFHGRALACGEDHLDLQVGLALRALAHSGVGLGAFRGRGLVLAFGGDARLQCLRRGTLLGVVLRFGERGELRGGFLAREIHGVRFDRDAGALASARLLFDALAFHGLREEGVLRLLALSCGVQRMRLGIESFAGQHDERRFLARSRLGFLRCLGLRRGLRARLAGELLLRFLAHLQSLRGCALRFGGLLRDLLGLARRIQARAHQRLGVALGAYALLLESEGARSFLGGGRRLVLRGELGLVAQARDRGEMLGVLERLRAVGFCGVRFVGAAFLFDRLQGRKRERAQPRLLRGLGVGLRTAARGLGKLGFSDGAALGLSAGRGFGAGECFGFLGAAPLGIGTREQGGCRSGLGARIVFGHPARLELGGEEALVFGLQRLGRHGAQLGLLCGGRVGVGTLVRSLREARLRIRVAARFRHGFRLGERARLGFGGEAFLDFDARFKSLGGERVGARRAFEECARRRFRVELFLRDAPGFFLAQTRLIERACLRFDTQPRHFDESGLGQRLP